MEYLTRAPRTHSRDRMRERNGEKDVKLLQSLIHITEKKHEWKTHMEKKIKIHKRGTVRATTGKKHGGKHE